MPTPKNPNCDKIQTQLVTKLKNYSFDKNLKIQIVTKLLICDKVQIVTKLKNSRCYQTQLLNPWKKLKKSNCDKTQKIKLWQNA